MKSERWTPAMWTEVNNNNNNNNNNSSSKMVDPDLSRHLSDSVHRRNGSNHPSSPDESLTSSSGIIPGAIAAAVFITFLLALYAVLWRCMVSPPQRKHSKVRVRVKPTTAV